MADLEGEPRRKEGIGVWYCVFGLRVCEREGRVGRGTER